MSAVSPSAPGFEPVRSILSQVQGRMRLNRALRAAALAAGALLAAVLAWRLLVWFDGRLPAASALVILLAILTLVVLLSLLVRVSFLARPGLDGAAAEADRRAGLKDELRSALWFARDARASDWTAAQLARAGRSAAGLRPERLMPVRLPRGAIAALVLGLLLLAGVILLPAPGAWTRDAGDGALTSERLQTLRQMVAGMPRSEAAQQLEQALRTLERTDATPEERREAMARAQDAVERMGLEAASTRDELHELRQALADRPGMQQVADALAQGDAQRAAQLLEQIEKQNQASGAASAAEPGDAAPGEAVSESALQEATQASGAQNPAPSSESVQEAMERLNEIARELAAADYVNEAWKSLQGALDRYQSTGAMTGGSHSEQTQSSSMPSPGSSDTPVGGGAMSSAPAMSQGEALGEQEGGLRTGNLLSNKPADPILGERAEPLEAQLQRNSIESADQDPAAGEERTWYYAESQQQTSSVSRRAVQARTRFAQAGTGAGGGISVEHRQIVRDYFMNLRENGQ